MSAPRATKYMHNVWRARFRRLQGPRLLSLHRHLTLDSNVIVLIVRDPRSEIRDPKSGSGWRLCPGRVKKTTEC